MRKEKLRISINLEKFITVDLKEGESPADILDRASRNFHENNIDDELYEKLLNSSELGFIYVESLTLKKQVKKAIDAFDPFCLMPGHEDGAPDDEYNPLSRRIADEITGNMFVEEIAEVIRDEFYYSFGREFSLKRCMKPAQKIYNYFHG